MFVYVLGADKERCFGVQDGECETTSEHESSHQHTSTTAYAFAESKPPSTVTAHLFVKSVEN